MNWEVRPAKYWKDIEAEGDTLIAQVGEYDVVQPGGGPDDEAFFEDRDVADLFCEMAAVKEALKSIAMHGDLASSNKAAMALRRLCS